MESNERGQSLVNIVPRNNNVLIKMEFVASVFAISSGKPSNEENNMKVKYSIAGFGPLVKDLTLGEEVLMKMGEYERVNVKGNNNSLESLKALYDTMKKSELNDLISSKEYNKANVIQYGIFPEFQIRAHIE